MMEKEILFGIEFKELIMMHNLIKGLIEGFKMPFEGIYGIFAALPQYLEIVGQFFGMLFGLFIILFIIYMIGIALNYKRRGIRY